jgi:hypothetical protein
MFIPARSWPAARAVLDTELHEAAHGLAAARDIRDASRQGRYDNARYRSLAEELGLAVEHTGSGFGWAATTVPDATAAVYAAGLGTWPPRWWPGGAPKAAAATGRTATTAWRPAAGPAAGSGSPSPCSPQARSPADCSAATSRPQADPGRIRTASPVRGRRVVSCATD